MEPIPNHSAHAFMRDHGIELDQDRRTAVQFCTELTELAQTPGIDLTDPVTVSGLRSLLRTQHGLDQPRQRVQPPLVQGGAY